MRFRFFTIGLACAGAAAGVLAAMACIPDLPDGSASTQDGAAPVPEGGKPYCGDNVIDLSAGEQCDPGPNGSAYCTSDCKVVCGDAGLVWPSNDHCYYDVPTGATSLDDAITRCSAQGAHVVTFASEAELDAVAAAFAGGPFWVGLSFDPTYNGYTSVHALEPGWDPSCSGCFAHVPDAAQPLPGDGGACVEGFPDLTQPWTQYPCFTDAGARRRLRVICEREPPGALSRGCLDAGISCIELAWTAGTKRYVYFHNAAPSDGPDASTAEQACASLGGRLVVLGSRDEREQLWKAIGATQAASSLWIGLSQPDGGTAWVWDDDAAVDAYPSPWGDQEPRTFGGSRAYLFQNGATPARSDLTLARNNGTPGVPSFYPFVCQLPP